tara:strand:+ start:2388 stop:2822 length:435 start_codon:yes stop_codon:yes gene_type:complete
MNLPELNSAQEKFLSGVASGVHSIPGTKMDLISMLESFTVMYNYEKHEEGFIFHSSKAFLKTLTRLGSKDDLGFAYISSVMQVVEKRRCFKNLADSTKNRRVKAERHLIEHLIKEKSIAVHSNQARITVEGTSKLDHMEFVNQY